VTSNLTCGQDYSTRDTSVALRRMTPVSSLHPFQLFNFSHHNMRLPLSLSHPIPQPTQPQPPIHCGWGSGRLKFKWVALKDSFQLSGSVRPVGVSAKPHSGRSTSHEGLVSLKASCRFCTFLSINSLLKQRHKHMRPNNGSSCVSEA